MKMQRRGWRAWLAAAVSAGVAVAGAFSVGRGSASLPLASSMAAGTLGADVTWAVPAGHQSVPAAVAPYRAAADGAAAPGAPLRRQHQRSLVPDAVGGQIQLPHRPAAGPVLPTCQSFATGKSRPAMFLPGWRVVLEHRWRERLATVTELSLAYHSAADRVRDGKADGRDGQAQQLRRLMRQTVMARQALTDTEDALARLSAGRFGQCEQCATMIYAAQLARSPEERYCAQCVPIPPHHGVKDGQATAAR